MLRVTLSEPDALDQLRDAARGLIAAGATPGQVIWQAGDSTDLFGDAQRPTHETPHFSVAAGFIELAGDVICHRDPERFALLYALLWRLTHNEKSLLLVAADPLVHRLRLMQKSVRRDTHKMTAFVRLRRVDDDSGEHYVAWFEPEHYILRCVSSFFVDRFAAMRWSILTPQGAMLWDMKSLTFGPAID